MLYFISFFYSFIFNDGRIFHKMFGPNIKYIKYRLVLKEIGLKVYLGCHLLSLSKGLLPLLLMEEYYAQVFLAFLVLAGNYLGAKPGETGGNELLILWGIWLGFDYKIVQTPLALLLSIWLISFKFKIGLWISSCIILFKLLYFKFFLLFLLSIVVLVNYGLEEYAQFSLLINRLKEILNFRREKGVKILNESILFSSSSFFAKNIKKNH